jgi:predicted nucleic acid-binding protein
LSSLVIDASVAAAWLFDDELHTGANALLARLYDGLVFVPQHWHFEVRNALLVGERRGRITSEQTSTSLSYLSELPLHTDTEGDLDASFDMARSHGLSFYDAIYLELARRRQAALATLDSRLNRAALAEGLQTLP